MTRLLPGCAALAMMLWSSAASASEATCPAEQQRRNEATARIVFEEMLSQGRIDENEHVYHPSFVNHGATRDLGRAEDRAAALGWRSLAPDLHFDIRHILADCDHVAIHWLSSGTATGSGNGVTGTGARVRLRGMTFFRLEGGRIIEEWSAWDNQSLMRQLGASAAGR